VLLVVWVADVLRVRGRCWQVFIL